MRKNFIQFRVTKAELDQIAAAAKAAGFGPGTFARHVVLSGIDTAAATAGIRELSGRVDAVQEAIEALAGLLAEESKKGASAAANEVFEKRQKPMLVALAEDVQRAIGKGPGR